MTLLFWLYAGVVVLQFSYYLSFFIGYALRPISGTVKKTSKPLSVIICAKNEAENLKKNLPILLQQEHSNYDIVLVNDNSSDNTLEVMEVFAESHPQVKVVNVKGVENFWGKKKYALTLGIKAASKPYLIFTDADCRPRSNQWLSYMAASFSEEKRIVLGYGAYKQKDGSLLNCLIRFETLLTAIQYFSYANLKNAYMGVGRNLGYHRDVFFDNSGFMKHMNVMSGDDDLFINSVATKTNVIILDHPESVTESRSKATWVDWLRQKRRHITTSSYYKPIHKFLLALFYFSQVGFLILTLILLVKSHLFVFVLALALLRYLMAALVYAKSTRKLNEKGLVLFFPFLEVILVLFQFFIFCSNFISRPKRWN
jgi:glycosyltransferase involved in cell wall biosynthesis